MGKSDVLRISGARIFGGGELRKYLRKWVRKFELFVINQKPLVKRFLKLPPSPAEPFLERLPKQGFLSFLEI